MTPKTCPPKSGKAHLENLRYNIYRVTGPTGKQFVFRMSGPFSGSRLRNLVTQMKNGVLSADIKTYSWESFSVERIVENLGYGESAQAIARQVSLIPMDKRYNRHTIHGCCLPASSDRRLYQIHQNMIQRTSNPNNAGYRIYGGKGVKICDQWRDFETFRRWALSNGYRDNLTIDRIDGDGDYEPANCRWVTKRENSLNRKTLLTKEQVAEIRTLYMQGHDLRSIRKKTGRNLNTLHYIIRNTHYTDDSYDAAESERLHQENLIAYHGPTISKKVFCQDNTTIYPSIATAGRTLGIKSSSIARLLRESGNPGCRGVTYGLRFRAITPEEDFLPVWPRNIHGKPSAVPAAIKRRGEIFQEEASEIRTLYAKGVSGSVLAERYGISDLKFRDVIENAICRDPGYNPALAASDHRKNRGLKILCIDNSTIYPSFPFAGGLFGYKKGANGKLGRSKKRPDGTFRAYGCSWKPVRNSEGLPEWPLDTDGHRSIIPRRARPLPLGQRRKGGRRIPVECVETKTVYPSGRDAQEATGIGKNLICACCKGKISKAGGFTWRYKGNPAKPERIQRVFRLISPEGKTYVGNTWQRDIEKPTAKWFLHHIRNTTYSGRIETDIAKLGWENFRVEILMRTSSVERARDEVRRLFAETPENMRYNSRNAGKRSVV